MYIFDDQFQERSPHQMIARDTTTKTDTLQPQREDPPPQHNTEAVSPYVIFSILLIPRLLAAQYSIIGDCDEGIAKGRIR
jgi:hypothetical protein